MDYQGKLSQLRSRMDGIDLQLAALTGHRKEHAYAAATGNEKSVQTIAELNEEMIALNQERQVVLDATEKCTALIKQQEAEADTKARLQREKDGRHHADTVLALSADIDAAMKALVLLFQKRSAAIAALATTRTARKYNRANVSEVFTDCCCQISRPACVPESGACAARVYCFVSRSQPCTPAHH